jgi:hypothetical protein
LMNMVRGDESCRSAVVSKALMGVLSHS